MADTARLGGLLLAGAIRAAGTARRSPKPLHPRGAVVTGTVLRHGGERSSGVAWLDEAGEDPVIVRLSRAVGLPSWLPDIHGLALRLSEDGERADLLLATTGLSRATRFLLTASRSATGRPSRPSCPTEGRTDRSFSVPSLVRRTSSSCCGANRRRTGCRSRRSN